MNVYNTNKRISLPEQPHMAVQILSMNKRINSACHFCDHAARRPGRQTVAIQVACQGKKCRKVFCSRPSCRKKLPAELNLHTREDFGIWKSLLEKGSLTFICQHCTDQSTCPGPQCHKRWAKRIQRISKKHNNSNVTMNDHAYKRVFNEEGKQYVQNPVMATTASNASFQEHKDNNSGSYMLGHISPTPNNNLKEPESSNVAIPVPRSIKNCAFTPSLDLLWRAGQAATTPGTGNPIVCDGVVVPQVFNPNKPSSPQ